MNHICPYCHHLFKRLPKHRSRCPNCGQMLWIKLAPGENTKKLVTSAQAMQIDVNWHKWDMDKHLLKDPNLPEEVELTEPKMTGDEILVKIKRAIKRRGI